MLKPSYAELMELLNSENEDSEEITSRYTIVIAAAKRARQIIDGDTPMVEYNGKPVSEAVDELFKNKIKIVPEGFGTVLDLKKNNEQTYRENEEFDKTNTMRKSDENNEFISNENINIEYDIADNMTKEEKEEESEEKSEELEEKSEELEGKLEELEEKLEEKEEELEKEEIEEAKNTDDIDI